MSTTTIRLPDELKARVASAAQQSATTTHNFILQAIAEKTDSVELQQAFYDEADARFADILANKKTIPWEQMRQYLVGRQAGQTDLTPPQPQEPSVSHGAD